MQKISYPLLLWLSSLLLFYGLLSCSPQTILNSPIITEVPLTLTPTFTSTIQWFPPTSTQTAFPTSAFTPTIEILPQTDQLLFTDNFTEPGLWSLNQTNTSSIALGKNEITLAVAQPGLYLYTLRNSPILDDFYLEITTSPGICIGEDEYGILIRVSPNLDFYRFVLTCDGQVRLDKYYNNRASSPQPNYYSGAVPPGAPSSSKITIWASGNDMHYFVNDQFQFSIRDPSIPAGTVGLFIRSKNENSLSVSFSELKVYSTFTNND